MTEKERYDQYAAEAVKRFEDFTQWAIANWPNKNFPLMQSDFNQGRRELSQIVGSKLGEGPPSPPAAHQANDASQYIETHPAPWP
jgi:hypothetical protein